MGSVGTVYRNVQGRTVVYSKQGQYMKSLSGTWEDVRDKIRKKADEETVWKVGYYKKPCQICGKKEILYHFKENTYKCDHCGEKYDIYDLE